MSTNTWTKCGLKNALPFICMLEAELVALTFLHLSRNMMHVKHAIHYSRPPQLPLALREETNGLVLHRHFRHRPRVLEDELLHFFKPHFCSLRQSCDLDNTVPKLFMKTRCCNCGCLVLYVWKPSKNLDFKCSEGHTLTGFTLTRIYELTRKFRFPSDFTM